MSRYKFDDCTSCRFRRRPDICGECDSGEYFEDGSIQPLRFDDDAPFRQADKEALTDDMEPDFDQDALIGRLDAQENDDDE